MIVLMFAVLAQVCRSCSSPIDASTVLCQSLLYTIFTGINSFLQLKLLVLVFFLVLIE